MVLQTLANPVMVPGVAALLVTARLRAGPEPQELLATTLTFPLTNDELMETEIEVPVLDVIVMPVGTVQV